MFDVSVVICTYKRAQMLEKTLRGVQLQTLDKSLFEVLVIDNGCDEQTRNLVDLLSNLMPNLLYLQERSLGLSYARNRGAQIAKGEWIIYLDDDAVPEKNWLKQMMNCIEKMPGLGILGGSVKPVWPSSPPDWLTPDFFSSLSICEYEGQPDGFILDFPRQYPVGANFAYPKELFIKYGGFKPRFGRRGGLLLSGEEIELSFRIHAAGYPICFCPNAMVHHHILPSRLTKEFFRSRFYWGGGTLALLHAELFGINYLRRQLFYRLTVGIALKLAGLFYYGILKRRSPFLIELWWREFFGYLAHGMRILRGKDAPDTFAKYA